MVHANASLDVADEQSGSQAVWPSLDVTIVKLLYFLCVEAY